MPKESTEANPLCFVAGPIGTTGSAVRKHADLLLNLIIREVLQGEEFGYRVKRADEDADPGMIGDRVVSDIINADLVIADLTELNPNVFYELGIRHSTEKPTIHVARVETPLPFDNVAHRTIFFDLLDWTSIEQVRSQLAEAARAIKRADFRVSNPITQANASFKMRQSADPRDQVIAEMQERISKLENAPSEPHTPPTLVNPAEMNLARSFKFVGGEVHAMKIYRTMTGCSADQAREFVTAMRSNQKIEAIKSLRNATKMSLSEAKDFVERIISYMNLF